MSAAPSAALDFALAGQNADLQPNGTLVDQRRDVAPGTSGGRPTPHEADDRRAPRGPAPAYGRADRDPGRAPGGGTREGGARRAGAGGDAARTPAPVRARALCRA